MSDNAEWNIMNNCREGNNALILYDPSVTEMTYEGAQGNGTDVMNYVPENVNNLFPDMTTSKLDPFDIMHAFHDEIGRQMGKDAARRANDQSSSNYELTNGELSCVKRYYDGKIQSMPVLGNRIRCVSVLKLQGREYARFEILSKDFKAPIYTSYIDMACFIEDKDGAMKFITTYCDVIDERCYKPNAQSALIRALRETVSEAPVLVKTGWVQTYNGNKYIRGIELAHDVAGYDCDIYEAPYSKSSQLYSSIQNIEEYIIDNKYSAAGIGFLLLFSIKALLNTLIGLGTIRQDTIVLYGDTDLTATIAKSFLRYVRRHGTDDNLSLYDYGVRALENYIRVTYDDVLVLDGNGYKCFTKKQRDVLDRLASGRRIANSNLTSPLAILMNTVSKGMDIKVPLVDCYGIKDSETIASDVIVLKNHIIDVVENGRLKQLESSKSVEDIYSNLASWIIDALDISGSELSEALRKGVDYAKCVARQCLKLPTQVFQHRISYLLRSGFYEKVDVNCCNDKESLSKFIEKDNKICMSANLISNCLSICDLDENGIALFIEKDLHKARLLAVYEGSDYRTDVWIPKMGKKISVLAIVNKFFKY